MASDKYTTPRLCQDCSTDISLRANRSVRCISCQQSHNRLLQRGYMRHYRSHDDGQAKERAYRRSYDTTEPRKGKHREREQKRRVKKQGQIGVVTPDIQARLMAARKCGLCGNRFTTNNPMNIDHVEPIAKGGLHDNGNFQALCQRCNYKKGARDPIAFARTYGRLL